MNDESRYSSRFSAFWPVLFIVLSLLFVNVVQLGSTLSQRSQINAAKAEMTKNLEKARFINQTFEALGRDMLALAPSNEAVAALVKELGLRQNPNAPAPADK